MTIQAWLELDEGRRPKLYQDTRGKWTIGIGRNLSDRPLSDDEIDYLFANDLKLIQGQAATFPWFAALDDVRQGAILNLLFNMGLTTLSTFHHFLAAMADNRFADAANELVNSQWIHQVQPLRSQRIIAAIRDGALPTTLV